MNLARLAGSLRVRPGQRPALVGGRPALAGRLLRGQPMQAATQRLPLLYSLCGRAHRIAAGLAVQAAQHGVAEPDAQARQALHEENRREHLRVLLLDWPRLLGDTPVSPPGLDLPLDAWFEGSARNWLGHWQADPRQALQDWSGRGQHALARLMQGCRELADTQLLPVRPLPADALTLREIGQQLAGQEHFVSAPEVHGEPCETGAWTRARDTAAQRHDTAWLRLGARLADFVALSQADTPALAAGALPLGPGQAIAWCETARGLLLHRVHLQGETIHDYQVLAPTEWNLHPRGTLARALEDLPLDGSTRRRAELLLAVFDPCLGYELDTAAIAPGAPCHA